MNLKPMDENTLAFLRLLIEEYKSAQRMISEDGFDDGYKSATSLLFWSALPLFASYNGLDDSATLRDQFMEAIKNANSKH